MTTDSSEILFLVLFVIALVFLLALMDVFLLRRRNHIANARYLAQMHETRAASLLHWRGVPNRATQLSNAGLVLGPVFTTREPGRFGRRRVVNDLLGRTVAIHYEELRIAEPSNSPMLLTAGLAQ